MRAHGPRDTMSRRPWRSHIPTVRYVSAAALLISTQYVRANGSRIFLGDEHCILACQPVLERLLSGPISRQSIRLTSTDGRFQNAPDRIIVRDARWADRYHLTSVRDPPR